MFAFLSKSCLIDLRLQVHMRPRDASVISKLQISKLSHETPNHTLHSWPISSVCHLCCTLPVDPMPESLTQFSDFSSVPDLRVPAFPTFAKPRSGCSDHLLSVSSISGQLNRQGGPSVQCKASSHYLATIWCTAKLISIWRHNEDVTDSR